MTNDVPQSSRYLTDTYCGRITTEVLDVGRDEDGKWLVLADNLFHSQGGGQPSDVGTVDGIRAVPFRSTDDRSIVALRLGGVAATFTPGQSVDAAIDLDLRLLHSALHTAGHVVQAIAEKRGWSVVANNHFPGQSRVEFKPTSADNTLLSAEIGRNEIAAAFQAEIERAISDRLVVTADEDEAGVRTVRIGDWHATHCGGTHVRNLGALAETRVSSIKLKKGTARVAYDASHAPEAS